MARARLGLVIVASAATMAGAGAGIGCQGNQKRETEVNQAAAERVPPALKNAAETYLDDLEWLAESMGRVRTTPDVTNMLQSAESTVNRIRAAHRTLTGATGEDRPTLMAAYGAKFQEANREYTEQVKRMRDSGVWWQSLEPVLRNVELFGGGVEKPGRG